MSKILALVCLALLTPGHAAWRFEEPGEAAEYEKQQRVMGIVVVKIIVDETGKVVEAEAVCGHPILAKAAVAAARGARFTPTTLSGTPVKVSGIITYNFVLQ
jgi:TonB family protein